MRFGFQRLDRGCCVGNGGLHDGWGWMWLGRHVLRSRSSLNNIVRAPETCQRMESVSWKVGCVKIRPHMSIPAPAIAPPYFIARYNCLDTGTTLIIIIAATDFESSFFFWNFNSQATIPSPVLPTFQMGWHCCCCGHLNAGLGDEGQKCVNHRCRHPACYQCGIGVENPPVIGKGKEGGGGEKKKGGCVIL